jgi:putative toxin-antitoxin system antitoxin component (TIGR02293 family)
MKDMKTEVDKQKEVFKCLPNRLSDIEILNLLQAQEITWRQIDEIKELTDLNDVIISAWLNVSVRSLRSYRQPSIRLKDNLKERVVVLLSLMKHGIQVFGTKDNFDRWLTTENFFLDGKEPNSFLNTITGIRFIDDRLTAMEYGDNV